MIQQKSYRMAFLGAICLHIFIVCLLLSEPSYKRPVMELATQDKENQPKALQIEPEEPKAIKATSVDSQEVMAAVNQLKAERLRQRQAEETRQRLLAQQAETARKQRTEELQRLEKLKQETAKLALERQKQLAADQLRLQQLAKQKAEEEKRLAEMKRQQAQLQKKRQEEAQRLAELKKKKEQEQAKANKEREEKAKAELEKKRQAEAARQAALDAERNARIAGEVNKYKALIINAISREWILPENANRHLSSQFRIRLAPNGTVLEVSLIRSSGDAILDRSAQSAIYKASPLPVPSSPETFNMFRDISLTVRPENARG